MGGRGEPKNKPENPGASRKLCRSPLFFFFFSLFFSFSTRRGRCKAQRFVGRGGGEGAGKNRSWLGFCPTQNLKNENENENENENVLIVQYGGEVQGGREGGGGQSHPQTLPCFTRTSRPRRRPPPLSALSRPGAARRHPPPSRAPGRRQRLPPAPSGRAPRSPRWRSRSRGRRGARRGRSGRRARRAAPRVRSRRRRARRHPQGRAQDGAHVEARHHRLEGRVARVGGVPGREQSRRAERGQGRRERGGGARAVHDGGRGQQQDARRQEGVAGVHELGHGGGVVEGAVVCGRRGL